MTKFNQEILEVNRAEIREDDEITFILEQDHRDREIEELRERLAKLEKTLKKDSGENKNKEVITIFSGSKTPLHGNNRGIECDDLQRISSSVNAVPENVRRGGVIENIRVKKIAIKHGCWIDFIRLTYEVKSQGEIHEVEGYEYGNKRGGEWAVIDFKEEEYISRIKGVYGENSWWGNMDELEIFINNEKTNETKRYSYGGTFSWFGRTFEISTTSNKPFICFFGRHNSSSLNGLGMYQGWVNHN